ncbi:hypothetical protein K1Y37_16570 [Serratia marcescens]|uniref:hypothetical protein n=1 Tax=Serratia marcescens TaxID=615 RepID=UPI002238F896|nr:hypothetical protein [Serratia marcescens]MCW6024430.1 hypothetical protein [Serratia marcescens]
MARESRLRRNLPIDIDLQVLQKIAVAVGANHKQYRYAYTRALKRTLTKSLRSARGDFKAGVAPRDMKMMERRVVSFQGSRGTITDASNKLGEGKIWFGLNAIKVKDLKGRVKGRIRPHHDRRDPQSGRFIAARRRKLNEVGFEPKGALLSAMNFPNGEVARSKREGRRTVLIRDPQTRRAREAEIEIYAAILDHIEDYAFPDMTAKFYREFENDLKGRIKARLNLDGRRM